MSMIFCFKRINIKNKVDIIFFKDVDKHNLLTFIN